MAFRVEIDPAAVAEIEEAYLWLAERSPAEAADWFNELHAAIGSLRKLPRRCALAPESDAFPVEIRQLLYGKRGGTYRILFVVDGEAVKVLRVRHGARRHMTRRKKW